MGSRQNLLAISIFAAALAYYFWFASIGFWKPSISDDHGFRQSQTAISIREMDNTGFSLAYHTPVLGQPWSLPFEFPAYQFLVHALHKTTGLEIIYAGRMVSMTMMVLSAILIALLIYEIVPDSRVAALGGGICLMNPYYIFWSRVVMIESCALALALLTLYAGFRLQRQPSWVWWGCGLVCGCLAAATKITTYLPIALLLFSIALWKLIANFRNGTARLGWHGPAQIISIVGASALTAIVWTRFADAQKQLNVLASHLSSGRLGAWNFGTLAQRLDFSQWYSVYQFLHAGLGRFGEELLIVFAAILLLGLAISKYRLWVGIFLLLYLAGPLIFFNLHVRHTYYGSANNIFLFPALVLAIYGVDRTHLRPLMQTTLTGVLIALLALSMSDSLSIHLLKDLHRDYKCYTSKRMKSFISPSDITIVFGHDWDSSLAFYSGGRALHYRSDFSTAEWFQALSNQDAALLNRIVVGPAAPQSEHELAQSTAAHLGLTATKQLACGHIGYYRTVTPS